MTPDHPAPSFLKALIIYWENFPLSPDNKDSKQFVNLMKRSVKLSEKYLENERTHLEGIFFDLFGRAFQAMYWADNGKSSKVVPDLRIMYKYTKEGFHLKDQFYEFYFSTGLYNYYIEAYPEAHPVYKPMLAFMHKGNKEKGLQQLNYAINHSVFLKVEATLFMSLIQLNYEKDLNTAAIYAERLYREYPRNMYYQGHLITILLHQHRYNKVRELLESTNTQKDNYSKMIRQMAHAFMAEKRTGNYQLAENNYWTTVKLADSFGPIADQFKAIAYMGLSRLHRKKQMAGEARRYSKKASNHTVYQFILDE